MDDGIVREGHGRSVRAAQYFEMSHRDFRRISSASTRKVPSDVGQVVWGRDRAQGRSVAKLGGGPGAQVPRNTILSSPTQATYAGHVEER